MPIIATPRPSTGKSEIRGEQRKLAAELDLRPPCAVIEPVRAVLSETTSASPPRTLDCKHAAVVGRRNRAVTGCGCLGSTFFNGRTSLFTVGGARNEESRRFARRLISHLGQRRRSNDGRGQKTR